MKKIFFIGDFNKTTKSITFLKYVEKNNIPFYYFKKQYGYAGKKNLINKIINKVYRTIRDLLNVYSLILSDIVYILPMNNDNTNFINFAYFLRKKIISDFFISFFDTYVIDRKEINNKKDQNKLKKKDQRLIKKSSLIVFNCISEKKYYLNLLKCNPLRVSSQIIPVTSQYYPYARLNYFNRRSNKLNICWWGTYIPLHGLDKIILSIKFLKEYNLLFHLYILGNSKIKSNKFSFIVEKNKLTKYVTIRNDLSFNDYSLPNFLINNCDLSLGHFGDSNKAKTVITQKIIESMSLRIPVLSQKTLGLNEYFSNNKNIYFSANNPQQIANRIFEISKTNIGTIRIAQNGFNTFNEFFSEKALFKYYKQLINSL